MPLFITVGSTINSGEALFAIMYLSSFVFLLIVRGLELDFGILGSIIMKNKVLVDCL